jgi:hypothetical protein
LAHFNSLLSSAGASLLISPSKSFTFALKEKTPMKMTEVWNLNRRILPDFLEEFCLYDVLSLNPSLVK